VNLSLRRYAQSGALPQAEAGAEAGAHPYSWTQTEPGTKEGAHPYSWTETEPGEQRQEPWPWVQAKALFQVAWTEYGRFGMRKH